MSILTVAALSTPQTVSLAALEACTQARALYVQTTQSPSMLPLTARGLAFTSMDDLYDRAEDFDALNQAIASRLLEALRSGDVVYALPGAGLSDALLALLGAQVQLRLLPGAGYAAAAQAAMGLAPAQAGVCANALALPARLDPYLPLAIEELDTRLRASEAKLHLSEYWPDNWPVHFGAMDSAGAYRMREISLFELDRQSDYSADTVALLPAASFSQLTRHGYEGLAHVTHILRAPGGCPWDREQTHDSLKKSLLEECYEVLDAIEKRDDDALCEELGDVLLQIAMHAEIASEQGRFHGRDVATGIVEKLVYRHPHVFQSDDIKTADEVLVKWEQLKKKEKHMRTQAEVLAAVPRCLPALVRSAKVQKKAAQVGFDWDSAEDALPKLAEELREFTEALAEGGPHAEEEMGDLLFAAVNVARLASMDAEFLLAAATDKFIRRFAAMEHLALEDGMQLDQMSLSEQDLLWTRIKHAEIGEEMPKKKD